MKFIDLMRSYLNKPFRKGGKDDRGYDCAGLVYAYCKAIGADFPTEFGGWTLDNYFQLYTTDTEGAEKLLCDCFSTIGEQVPRKKAVAGDIVVVHHQNGRLFPGVYIGNNQVIASFLRIGVKVIELDTLNYIYIARRVR